MISYSNTWFLCLLIISLMMGASSSSLFFLWVALEVNMVAVLPLIVPEGSPAQSEVMFKYFMSQSVASIFFLFIFLASSQALLTSGIDKVSIMFPIFLKMGVAPFHGWLVSILSMSPMIPVLIISTIQKFIPLLILEKVSVSTEMLVSILLMNLVVILSFTGSVNNIRTVLFISSSGNMLWAITLALTGSSWGLFYVMYCFSFSLFIMILMSSTMNGKLVMTSMSSTSKVVMACSFLSLAGMPPFPNFIMKLTAFFYLQASQLYFPAIILIVVSLFVLFSYLSVAVSGLANYVSPRPLADPNMSNMALPAILMTAPFYLLI